MGCPHALSLLSRRDVRRCWLWASVGVLATGPVVSAQSQPPQVALPEPIYRFEITGISEPVEHVFFFTNNTTELIETAAIKVTPPLTVTNISARVFPGQGGMLRFRLGEPRPVGEYTGFIEVDFKNPGISNITFEVAGRITPRIEAKPFPAFFVATRRGRSKEASIQLINHGQEALEIARIECASTRFSLQLETNQPGQCYTLVLKLSGEGTPGRAADRITLHTSNKQEPVLLIGANTFIHERVHTFPEELDFGTIEGAQVRTNDALRKTLTQILMVYQDGGTNFQLSAKSDLSFVDIVPHRSQTGGQVQIEVALKPQELAPGDFQGRLELRTNDREFPGMQVAVRGHVR